MRRAFAGLQAEALAATPPVEFEPATRARLEALRLAAERRRRVELHYLDLQDSHSVRTVRPLGCFYWGAVWTLAAWCETRESFRNFRVDRIQQLRVLEASFRDEPGKTLADLFRLTQGHVIQRPADATGAAARPAG